MITKIVIIALAAYCVTADRGPKPKDRLELLNKIDIKSNFYHYFTIITQITSQFQGRPRL